MQRVGDRMLRGLSQRELGEELVIEALRLTEASYGCLIRLGPDQKLLLDACVSINVAKNAAYEIIRHQDKLLDDTPDELFVDVIETLKPAFSNHISGMASNNLPSFHPTIENYSLSPIHESGSLKSLLLIANTTTRFDLVLIKRLQNMLDAFIRVNINTIVNRGVNDVMADVGSTNRQLLTLLQASFNGVLAIDENAIITAFNPACERMFGTTTLNALNKNAGVFFTQSVLEEIRQHAMDYHQSLHIHNSHPYQLKEVELIKADGQRFSAQLSIYHSRVEQQVFTTVVIDDLNATSQSNLQLQNTKVQYETLTNLAPVGILKLDHDWLCDYANEMWCQLCDRDVEHNLRSGWIEAIDEEYQSHTLMDMRNALYKGDTYRQIVRLHRPDSKNIWVSLNARSMSNSLGEFTGTLIVVMDITEQHLAEQRLTQMAHHDALTGLLNRTRFLEHLHAALASRKPHGIVALLFIDLDGFKAVNDTLGHDAGDELLKQVAVRLNDAVPENDTIARLGGDEFTVILNSLDRIQDASVAGDSIVHSIKQPFLLRNEEVYVSASVGIAVASGVIENTSMDANSLIKQADVALYRAKLSGRSRHVFFTAQLDKEQRDRSVLITSLRRAVDRQDFVLFYQPQLLIKEQTLLGFEALLRWPQADGSFLPPCLLMFLPVSWACQDLPNALRHVWKNTP